MNYLPNTKKAKKKFVPKTPFAIKNLHFPKKAYLKEYVKWAKLWVRKERFVNKKTATDKAKWEFFSKTPSVFGKEDTDETAREMDTVHARALWRR